MIIIDTWLAVDSRQPGFGEIRHVLCRVVYTRVGVGFNLKYL